jgi:RNA polymerase sigma factor (sigma-70 family)
VRRGANVTFRGRCLVELVRTDATKGAGDTMTTPSEPGDGRPDPSLSAIMSERRQLINLSYRLLGSLAEAEDAVQETYARWYTLSSQQQQAIESPGAWLTKVASRICLNLLSSARARRENYVGDWIPEPLPEPAEWSGGRAGSTTIDPADRVTLDESINMALLVVLESMTPAERVAFILHDVFRYPFAEVAASAARQRPAASWPHRPAGASAPRRHPRPQPPGRPPSSGTSSRPGKPRTSTPSSASSTRMSRQPATAAASPPPCAARSKTPSRSRAASSISPAGWPT